LAKDAAKLERRQHKLDRMNASAALMDEEERKVQDAVDASRPPPKQPRGRGRGKGRGRGRKVPELGTGGAGNGNEVEADEAKAMSISPQKNPPASPAKSDSADSRHVCVTPQQPKRKRLRPLCYSPRFIKTPRVASAASGSAPALVTTKPRGFRKKRETAKDSKQEMKEDAHDRTPKKEETAKEPKQKMKECEVEPGEEDKHVDDNKQAKKDEAKAKRQRKAKIAWAKMAATIPPGDVCTELCIPGGTEYAAVSYTLQSAAPDASSIGVILYTETFYVTRVKKIPETLKKWFKVPYKPLYISCLTIHTFYRVNLNVFRFHFKPSSCLPAG